MNYLYRNTIKNFIYTNAEEILNTLAENFKKSAGTDAGQMQINAWQSSIRFLQKALDSQYLYNLHIVFEYRIPFSNERADILVFGKNKIKKPTVVFFELKGWREIEEVNGNFVKIKKLGTVSHPEYQIENYTGKIKYCHSKSGEFNIIPAVLMYNLYTKPDILTFKNVRAFFKNDISGLQYFLVQNLHFPIEEWVLNDFLDGEFQQSNKLFNSIKKHFVEIKEQSHTLLARNGWGLFPEQQEIVDSVLNDLKNGEKDIVYLVKGIAGSGKTLVAIHLLLSSLTNGYQSVLAYRNNRLVYSLREIFDSVEKGYSSMIKFYSTGKNANFRGVAEKNFKNRDLCLVIYDEAQRMNLENIHYAMKRGEITVFLFDEKQILNADEKGFFENFKQEALKQGKKIKTYELNLCYRLANSSNYLNFIENLLANPLSILERNTAFNTEHYEFAVFEDIEKLKAELNKKVEKGFQAALLAALTETPGDRKNKNSEKNIRIGFPLHSGFDLYRNTNIKISSLIEPKEDYVPFWVKRESNKLERCASIYGSQGFETDYSGVIWGRDLVFRNGKWELGESCEDMTGNPSLKQLFLKAKTGDKEAQETAKILLINRYRVFLTRGIKGSFLFCEDRETHQFFTQICNRFKKGKIK